MVGYLVTGAVVVAVGVGIVKHRRKRRAEEEQRGEEQRRFDDVLKQQNAERKQRQMQEQAEVEKRLNAEEEKRAAEAKKQAELRATFKERFGKIFVEANLGWHRKVLESEVDSMLHATAYALHEAFGREHEIRNKGTEGSALLGATTVSAQLKKRFWELFAVARDLELPVRWHIMPSGENVSNDFVAVLPQTVKDQMVASSRNAWSVALKIRATYRAYVSPIDTGFFTGNVSFCKIAVERPISTKFEESVDALTVGKK